MYINNGNSNVLSAIGNTPIVELTKLNGDDGARIFVKLEGNNPGGSIKDRPAYYMITRAEKSGELTKDKIIIEPTSGNTGIAIAMIGAAKGYKVRLYMPECVSMERQLILQAFGAEVILTPAKENVDGAIRRAHEALNAEPGKYFMPNQFDNPNNVLAHYETTGPEIFKQMDGKIDVFVCAMGTTGTLVGTSRYLKEKVKDIKIVGIEPAMGHTIQGLKNLTESAVPGIYDASVMDEKLNVEDGDAFETARMLAVREGLFSGMSSGAAVAGALKVARTMKKGNIAVILPDRGDRYLSTTLFRSICAKCPP
ncbi:MAG: cysteine synthase family protein [Dehalococcoidales bacterium]|nr:cysteine synthase family protein [Dehalococcoidales bacterium]